MCIIINMRKSPPNSCNSIFNAPCGSTGYFTSSDRYVDTGLSFDGYHAAHFLLVVGADGMNYLGAEVKYQPQYAIADLA